MKIFFIVFALIFPLMIGCSDSSVNPEVADQANTLTQPNNLQKSWIKLPPNPDAAADSEYSASNLINGEIGGTVELNVNYVRTGQVNVIIDAVIEVPAGAYSGEKDITMFINSTHGTATFYPSPETFNKPLIFNLRISGVELNGVDPKTIDYVYLAPDGTFEPIEYRDMVINEGILQVKDALIPHFSIYGWCR